MHKHLVFSLIHNFHSENLQHFKIFELMTKSYESSQVSTVQVVVIFL